MVDIPFKGRSHWQKFTQNKFSIAGLVFIGIALIISILGYIICPDPTPYGNQQFLQLATRKPGFNVNMLYIRKNTTLRKRGFLGRMLYGEENPYKLYPLNKIWIKNETVYVEDYSDDPGEEFISTFSIADVVFPIDQEHELIKDNIITFKDISNNKRSYYYHTLQDFILEHQVKNKLFLLGTDRFGRDLLSRIIIGTRISFSVGFISVLISLVIGISLGSLAGYFKGTIDKIIMWLINVVWTIPTLLMVIAITFVLGKGFWQVFIAVGLTMWVEVARIVRGQVLSIREKEYIEACRAMGYKSVRIIVRHILPNIIGPVIIISTANFASAILLEAGLSFLGIGVQPPMPSWGALIKDHYGFIIVNKAYLALIPGIAIMLLVLSFTMVGNGLRDALDYKSINK